MTDLPFVIYLGLLALMPLLAVRADFRRRASAARLRQESDLRAARGETTTP